MSSPTKSPYDKEQDLSSPEREFLEKLGEALEQISGASHEIPFEVTLKNKTPLGTSTATATPGAVSLGWCWNGAVFVRC
jgi:hypothetical protein